jgi:AraC-like DNA-binding protein
MQATKLVDGFLDAWNQYDARGVASFLSNQGIYFDRLINKKFSRPALIQYLHNLFTREKHQYQLHGDILVGQTTIAYQYRALDLSAPDSGLAEYGAEFLSLHGGKIVNIEVYYNTRPGLDITYPGKTRTRSECKYRKSGLGPQQAEIYKTELRKLMEVDKLFLSPQLTLPVLAQAMNCTVNHLSQVINGSMGTSFYDLVNSYRIAEAKRLLLQNPAGRSFVLSIANRVGFNSNSAFYAAFKKHCRQTPLQYRRSVLSP